MESLTNKILGETMKEQDKKALCTWLEALEEFPHEGVRRDLEIVQLVVAALPEGKTGHFELSQDHESVSGHICWLDFDNAMLSLSVGNVNFEWNPCIGAKMFLYGDTEPVNEKYIEWARKYNVPTHYIPDKTK